MSVLPYFKKNHGYTAVLAKRYILPSRNPGIFYNMAQDLFPEIGLFSLLRLLKSS